MVITKIKQEQPLCVFFLRLPKHTFFFTSPPFTERWLHFLSCSGPDYPGMFLPAHQVLAILLLAADPCLCDLLFHSCSGRKEETSCLAAAHMEYEYSGMHTVHTDLALKPCFCLISILLLHYYKHCPGFFPLT